MLASNVPVPPPNVGPETNAVAYAIPSGTTYEAFFVDSGKTIGTLSGNNGSVFAGPRDDPFWVDLGAIFDLAQLRPVANPTDAAARQHRVHERALDRAPDPAHRR